jgi:catechol 2,3-dioxygenase-like lactoylglutathione lyase family enzyme
MKIYITSVFVDDQAKAEKFYCEILGFKKNKDIPVGEYRWLTVSQNGEEGEMELLLEPSAHPAVAPYREALKKDGIPLASFMVDDLAAEHKRLSALGVTFTQDVTDGGDFKIATLDDSCGNLIQLIEMKSG